MFISLKLTPAGKKVFVADSTFAEKDVVKSAGFRWHDPSKGPCWSKQCAGCEAKVGKKWWTDSLTNAARLAEWADDEAKAALAEVITAVEQSRAESAVSIQVPCPEGLTMRPFQEAGVEFILNVFRRGFKGALEGDDMGLGKTIQACGVINADSSFRRVLVLAANSLRINWKREAEKWLVRKETRVIIMDKSLTSEVLGGLDDVMVIINSDKLVGPSGKKAWDVLMGEQWDLLICDEAHAFKNPKAQRTQRVLGDGLVSKARHFLPMTGTPIPNRPVEMHPLLAACAPDEFPFFPYVKRFCAAHQVSVPGPKGKVWDFTGSSNEEELQAKLRGTIMIRRLKADVLKELPPKIRQVIVLPREGKPSPTLESDFNRAVAALEAGETADFTEFSAQRHEEALAKAPLVVEYLNDLFENDPTRKVLLFAHHLDVVDYLFTHTSVAAVKMTGDSTPEQRDEAVQAFQNDPAVRLFVGNDAAKEGLTLTAANLVLFAEEDWVPSKISQKEDRAYRIGQMDSVLVQHLVVDGTLDALMIKVIVDKQEIADRILDRKEDMRGRYDAAMEAESIRKEKERSDRPEPRYPVASAKEREWAAQVVRFLAGACDGAVSEDGAGFNKLDTKIGTDIARRSYERSLTDGEVAIVKKFAVRYRNQLSHSNTQEPANG